MTGVPRSDDLMTVTAENAETHVVSEDAPPYAGQILDGAKAICKYLIYLGFTEMTEKRVFNWAADGRLPVIKIGSRLVTNKNRILRHFAMANPDE